MRAIVAMAGNRVIGNGIRIPWHLPDDFKWFKKTTMGGNLLMGNTTFNAIGRPLPGRFTYVLTRNQEKLMSTMTEGYSYTDEAKFLASCPANVWVCGGSQVYERFLPMCEEVYVTHVIGDFEGDIFMPPFEDMFSNQTIVLEHKDFWIVKHTR